MRQIGGRPKPWAKVLGAIHAGQLSASISAGEAPIALRIMVKSEKLLATQHFQPSPDMTWDNCIVTKTDMADIMNIHPPHFSRYSNFLIGPGPNVREIRMKDVLNLAQTYVSTREISRRLGVHPRRAEYLTRFNKVKRAVPGLFYRASAEALIPGF